MSPLTVANHSLRNSSSLTSSTQLTIVKLWLGPKRAKLQDRPPQRVQSTWMMMMMVTMTVTVVIITVKEQSTRCWQDLMQILPLPPFGRVTSLTLSDLHHH